MVDLKMERPQLSAAQLKPLMQLAAVACVLIAAWFAWNGWEHYRDHARRESLQQSRDEAVRDITAAVKSEHARMNEKLASVQIQDALKRGDFTAAAARLSAGWPNADGVTVVAPNLDDAYEALPKGSYGRLAALEAALLKQEPVAWVVRDGDQVEMMIVAPARFGKRLVAIAVVPLAIERVTGPVQSAAVGEENYLALRQGGYNVLQRGDETLAGGAEAMSKPVPGSELRVVASVPDVSPTPFGLSALACLVVSGLLLLLAVLALRLPAWLAARERRAAYGDEDGEESLALQELVERAAREEAAEEGAIAAAGPGLGGDAKTTVKPRQVAIDRGIFRAYDIRGVVGETLDPGIAELIGHAIGSLMQEKDLVDIVVGRDGRLSGPDMVDGLVRGLRAAGRNVTDIGLAPTPLVYFGTYHLHAGSSVAVTGSHNPPDYNGFKIVIGGETLHGEAIIDLYDRIAEDRLYTSQHEGRLESQDISEDYVQRVSSDVQIDKPLKVVVDAGNGVAGDLGPRVLAAIGADVTPLYCEIDGTFPNHHPDPSDPRNLSDLIQMVDRLDADLGIAFDGDGDRLGVVTRDGKNIFPDRLLMLFAADVLDRNPGAMIIYDVKCTGRLPGHILRHGGSPLMWKTGHSLIKAKMRETDAELAGEMSGHFFFKERWYGFDDGIYAAARLLEILAARPETATETLNALPDGVATAEIKVDAPGGDPHAFVERFVERARFEGARISTIDGLRVDWPDGWGLVRASNTTPVLVMRFDAESNDAMLRIKDDFRAQLLAIQPDLALPF